MWYKTDIIKLGYQLLPPILRSKILTALLKALLHGVRGLHGRFISYRAAVLDRLNITAGVQYVEKALNDAFFLEGNQIYIETVESVGRTVLRFMHEGQAAVYVEGNSPLYARTPGDMPQEVSFIIHVPSFLCTSLMAAEDKYKGRHLGVIMNILNHYKPAGRMFRIELYNYE